MLCYILILYDWFKLEPLSYCIKTFEFLATYMYIQVYEWNLKHVQLCGCAISDNNTSYGMIKKMLCTYKIFAGMFQN